MRSKPYILNGIFIFLIVFGMGCGAKESLEPSGEVTELKEEEYLTETFTHEGEERDPPSNPDRPQVHNPDGGFFVEDHSMWSCVDCHDYITEIPHPEEIIGNSEVDCTNCHDEAPTKE